MPDISKSGYPSQGADALRAFQLTTKSIKEKSDKEFGLSVSREIFGYTMSGLQGYFYNRNARFVKNRNYANGRINIQAMFQDRFQFNGKQNYIALNWNALQIVNRIVSGLVGRWMKRNEKISVKAIDTLSVKEKEEEYEKLEFIIDNRKKLEQLQEQSGVQLIPENTPTDKEQLLLWQAQLQRLPEEIQYELGCNDVLSSNGWFDVLKEKMLHDAAETLFVGTYTYMDDAGFIHVEWLKPENCIYSYSDYPDFRDTSWRGYLPSRKISELRRMYGKEFHPENPYALSEEDLWDIAMRSKDFQYWNNLQWTDIWVTSYMRPYDEWNVRTVEFEFKSVDSEPYTKTKTNKTGTEYLQKGMPKTRSGKPKEKSENQEIISDTNWNIYRGVYLPDSDRLLEWGIKKNMIRPQDPKEIGNAEFSYSFYMPQNYVMRNLAIPEKIEAAVDGMILACLKMQQVIARMRPTGAAINEDALQAIDYGLGDSNKEIDYKKLYDQTGDIYYRGRDAEGNPIPIPITELQNNGFLGQMEGLIKDYQFHYSILKDELGEDPNLITAAIQPRVTGENVEASQSASEEATDYIYKAYSECMKITSRKISCLLKDSVVYGSSAYRKIVNEEEIGLRQFTTDIQFLPTQLQLDKFEAMIINAFNTTKDLSLFVNHFQLMEAAKQDIKLAWALYNQAQKRMLAWQRQTAMENQQATIDGQIKSAQIAEQEKRETEKEKINGDIRKSQVAAQSANQSAVVNLVAALLKPVGEGGSGGVIPPELKPVVNAVIDNIMVGAIASSEEQKAQLQKQILEAREEQKMQQQQMMQQQNQIQQPQPEQQMVA